MESGSTKEWPPVTAQQYADATEQEKLGAESYLKALVDYVKWTTTLAAAAILWVGNGLMGLSSLPQVVATAGLLFLLASLMTAVFAAFYVLKAWGNEWAWRREWQEFCLLDQRRAMLPAEAPPTAVEGLKRISLEQMDRALEALSQARTSRDPAVFRRWAMGHVGLLVAGLCAYVLAQLLALN